MVGAVVMLAEAVTFDRERRIDIIDDNIAVGIVMVELQHRAEHEHSHSTEIPETMMDFRFAPSQTISSGARADLGRLLSTTRYGSSTSESPALYQSSSAAPIPRTTTIAKLSKVSNKVTPACRKIDRKSVV